MIVTDFFFLLRVLSLSFQGSLWSVFMLSFCTVLEVHAQPVKCQCGKLASNISENGISFICGLGQADRNNRRLVLYCVLAS